MHFQVLWCENKTNEACHYCTLLKCNLGLQSLMDVNQFWNVHEWSESVSPWGGSAVCGSFPFQLILMTNSQLTVTDAVTAAPSAGETTSLKRTRVQLNRSENKCPFYLQGKSDINIWDAEKPTNSFHTCSDLRTSYFLKYQVQEHLSFQAKARGPHSPRLTISPTALTKRNFILRINLITLVFESTCCLTLLRSKKTRFNKQLSTWSEHLLHKIHLWKRWAKLFTKFLQRVEPAVS